MAGRVTFTPPDLMALAYIARNMRARDRDECLACGFTTPDALAAGTFAAGGVQWLCWLDARPVASLGAHPLWPNVWQCWAWGTDEWPRIALSMTRQALRVLRPALLDVGVHRAQCASLGTHTDAHAWLESMGWTREAVLRRYGRQGQDFVMFSYVPAPEEDDHVQ